MIDRLEGFNVVVVQWLTSRILLHLSNWHESALCKVRRHFMTFNVSTFWLCFFVSIPGRQQVPDQPAPTLMWRRSDCSCDASVMSASMSRSALNCDTVRVERPKTESALGVDTVRAWTESARGAGGRGRCEGREDILRASGHDQPRHIRGRRQAGVSATTLC